MKSTCEPLVSVLTPVYNGEKYLEECIESVMNQTYDNWEYIIVNNCSTDNTLKISAKYAARDKRISVHNNSEFLSIMANHNHALSLISNKSEYCKIVHADDFIYPDCLSQMVDIAERYNSVGIVSSYRLNGKKVDMNGIPYTSSFISGRDICRMTMINGINVFGTPTSLMLRARLVRSRPKYFDENHWNSDRDACYRELEHCDFGFVHQVLTFTRAHDEQVSAVGRRYSFLPSKLNMIEKYGPTYLDSTEYMKALKDITRAYYKLLAQNVFHLREKEFWDYHKNMLEAGGSSLKRGKLVKATMMEFLDKVLNPKMTAERFINKLKSRSFDT